MMNLILRGLFVLVVADLKKKIGEISEPVKLPNGYSIIKVEDKVTRPIITEPEYLSKKNKFEQIK